VLQFDKIPSVLHWFVEKFYADFLLNKYVRPVVVSSAVLKGHSGAD